MPTKTRVLMARKEKRILFWLAGRDWETGVANVPDEVMRSYVASMLHCMEVRFPLTIHIDA